MKPVKINTAWGVVTLSLDSNGKVVALELPCLTKTPTAELSPADFFPQLVKKFGPVKIPEGTEFQQAVWREMKKIPRGQTRTYSEIASAIGRPNAVRAVGTACGANPLPVFIPCHRVVAKNGLGGFGRGLPWKVLLLRMEGAL
jgi:O-6-methylguanine DNA methyltransferase